MNLFFKNIKVQKVLTTALYLAAMPLLSYAQEATNQVLVSSPQNATGTEKKYTPADTIKKVHKDTIIYSKHLVGVYGGYGISTLKYSPSFGSVEDGMNLTVGADYFYFFSKKWGISAGLNFSRYTSVFSYTGNTSWSAVDSETETFDLLGSWNGWKEEHSLTTLGIPIMARFRHSFNPKWALMAGAGIKAAFALSGEAKSTEGSVTLSGYYPRLNVLFEDLPYQGFVPHNFREKTEFESSLNLSLVGEFNVMYYINPAWALTAGVYVDYGVTNLSAGSNEPLISYESATNTPVYNTIPQSNVATNEASFAAGGKIGVVYDFGGALYKKQIKAEEEARLAAIAALKAQQEARDKFVADSIAEANRRAEELRQAEAAKAAALAALLLRQKQIQDSIEAARQKHIQDSINALASKGEGKMIVEIKTDKLQPWEREILMLPVEFALGSANMTPESKKNADKIGNMLAQHPAGS